MPTLCQAVCLVLGTESKNMAVTFKELIVHGAEGEQWQRKNPITVIQERAHSSVVSVSLMQSVGLGPTTGYELSSLEQRTQPLHFSFFIYKWVDRVITNTMPETVMNLNTYLWSKRLNWLNQKGVEAERRGSQGEQQPEQKTDVVDHMAHYGNCMWFFYG